MNISFMNCKEYEIESNVSSQSFYLLEKRWSWPIFITYWREFKRVHSIGEKANVCDAENIKLESAQYAEANLKISNSVFNLILNYLILLKL